MHPQQPHPITPIQPQHQQIIQTHHLNKQSTKYQTINDIFTRLPHPQKNNYKFPLKTVSQNMQISLEEEKQILNLLKNEQQLIDQIQLGTLQKIDFNDEQKIQEDIFSQQLPSGKPLHKSVQFWRNQKFVRQLKKKMGQDQPFLPDSISNELNPDKNILPYLKIFLEYCIHYHSSTTPLFSHQLHFLTPSQLIFKNQFFPPLNQTQTRALFQAKLYLLQLYMEQTNKSLLEDRLNQLTLLNSRHPKPSKQPLPQPNPEPSQDSDLLQQVQKIKQWLFTKITSELQQLQSNNDLQRETVEKNFVKLTDQYNFQNNPTEKLKILMKYKFQKGW